MEYTVPRVQSQVLEPRTIAKPSSPGVESPYSGRDSRWQPGDSRSFWDGVADLASAPVQPGRFAVKNPQWWVWGLLMHYKVPVLRRVLETAAVFDLGLDPVDVTNALRLLRGHSAYMQDKRCSIVHTSVRLWREAKPSDIYTFNRSATNTEIDELRELYRERERTLSKQVLKDAGERYVRGMLKASGRFASVTAENRLGEVRDQLDRNALDLVARDKGTGTRYGISVKNLREWLRPDDKSINDVRKKAAAHGVHPWLVVPFAMDDTVARCRASGIRLTLLRRQIIPAEDSSKRHMRDVVGDLRAVIGSQPFEFLNARFDRTLEQSAEARRDIEALRMQ